MNLQPVSSGYKNIALKVKTRGFFQVQVLVNQTAWCHIFICVTVLQQNMDVMDAEHDPDYGSSLRCNTGSCLIEIKEEKDPLFEYSEELVSENEVSYAFSP